MMRSFLRLFLFFLFASNCVLAQEIWISRPTGVSDKVLGVVFSNSTDGWGIASGTTSGERLGTTDNGVTWTSTPDTLLHELNAIYFYDAQRAWAVGQHARILRTTDGGLQWQLQNSDTNSRVLTSVHFANSSVGWAAGYISAFILVNPIIFKTVNGGNTWNITYNPANVFDQWLLNDIFCVDQNICWAAGYNRLLRSTNGGSTWNKETTNVHFIATFFISPSTGWVAGANNTIWKSTDGGVQWSNQSVFGTNILYDVYFRDSLNGWVAGQNGRIYQTSNSGAKWNAEASNTTSSLVDIFPGNDGSIWIAGENGTLLQSAPVPPAPVLSLSSPSVNFGSIYLGQFKDTAISIGNTGDDTLVIADITASKASYSVRTTAMTLLPGESFMDTLRFTPSVFGQDNAVLRITSNTPSGHDSIPLIGSSPLSQPTIIQYQLADQWNLLSLTLLPDDPRKSVLFPTAGSPAYVYSTSYVESDTLEPGKGYWMKFTGAQSNTISGAYVASETVAVTTGWNLIGSHSSPLPAAQIVTIPPGIVTTPFFKFVDGYYYYADTLFPGRGHWVKSSSPGVLLLENAPLAKPSQRIKIIPTGELPPALRPPGK